MCKFRHWPDDFPLVVPTSEFDIALIDFFNRMVASGTSVHVDDTWSLFGFARGTRMIDFVRRGQLRRGAGMCWEVWPYDDGECRRLGRVFGIRDCACVVICGIDDVRAVTECWLNGMGLVDIVERAEFWDKMDVSKPLELAT